MSWFYVAMQREPVVMWSCFIGFTGASPPIPASVVSLHSETLPIRKGFCSVRPIRPGGSPVVDQRCIDCDRGSHVVPIVRTRERRHSRPVLPNPCSPPLELQLTMIISSPLSSPRHDVARRRASHPGRLQQRTETQGPAQPPHGGQGANGEVIRFGA